MKLVRVLFGFILLASSYLTLYVQPAHAVAYDLIAPSGTLTRGQNVDFIVNIDSEATSVSSVSIGMTYESQYIQFVSVKAGDAMTSVTATESTTGTLVLNGTNTPGFNGSGIFAYVTFKIIAQSPGSAELCALFAPNATPTVAPVAPTALPQTGTVENTRLITIVGAALLLTSVASLAFLKRAKL